MAEFEIICAKIQTHDGQKAADSGSVEMKTRRASETAVDRLSSCVLHECRRTVQREERRPSRNITSPPNTDGDDKSEDRSVEATQTRDDGKRGGKATVAENGGESIWSPPGEPRDGKTGQYCKFNLAHQRVPLSLALFALVSRRFRATGAGCRIMHGHPLA